jgi:ribosomal protein S20
MPIIKSAKKAAKQSIVKNIRNTKTRRTLHDVQKDFYALIKEEKTKEATAMISTVYKVVDTAAKKFVIPANRASRLKAKAAKNLASIAK